MKRLWDGWQSMYEEEQWAIAAGVILIAPFVIGGFVLLYASIFIF